MTKKEYEQELNEIGIPRDDDRLYGGRCPHSAQYGTWMRKHDPIQFEVGYREATQK